MTKIYVRNPSVAVVAHADRCLFIASGKSPVAVDASWVVEVLPLLSAPVAEDKARSLLGKDRLAFLVEHGIVMSATARDVATQARAAAGNSKRCGGLVLGITGAVASMQVAPLVLELRRQVAEHVDVVLTDSAKRFVNPAAFPLLGIDAWCDAFTPRDGVNVPHVYLGERADLIAVIPASAHTLHKLAQGACSDLLSLTIAASRAPVVLAPAMNAAMWTSPAVSRNVRQLREDGFYIVEPGAALEISVASGASQGGIGMDVASIVSVLNGVLAAHVLNRPPR